MAVVRLGHREIEILSYFAEVQGGITYWRIVARLCGKKPGPEASEDERRAFESCRVATTRALGRMRRKDLVYKKKYKGEVTYYLTRRGRELLNRLSLGP